MQCIICQDTGLEPVQDNTTCSCKYKCHSSCWIDYVHSREKVNCPLCRKDLSVKKNSKPNSTILTPLIQSVPITPISPYTSEVRITLEESSRQITYQEFVNTIQQYNSYRNIEIHSSVQPQPLSSNQSTKGEKIIKIIVCFGILVAVIVLICIFA